MIRLYRVTKNKYYLSPIISSFLIEKNLILKDLSNLKKGYITKRSKELFKNFKKKKGVKEIKRQEIFINRKEYLFYYRIIEHLYFWKVLGISNSILNKYYKNGLKFLKNTDIKKLIFDQSLIKYYGTQLVNYVYYLKTLGIIDLRSEFKEEFIKLFMNERKNFSKYMYKNKIYGLTHFIIAGSNYYQKFVSLKDFGWIIDYFKKNIKEILTRTDIDIISEVGLCFKLCKINHGKEIELITKYLLNAYDEKLGYIPRDKHKEMNISEHTDAVAYLFLCNFKKLYKGPNIGKAIEKFK